MIYLDAATKSLELILGGAVATNQLPFTVAYVDTAAAAPIVEADGATTGAVAVTLIPAQAGQRVLKGFTIQQADTAVVTATVRINNNGTFRTVWKATLAVGDNVVFDGDKFNVYDSSGTLRSGSSNLGDPVTVAHGGTGVATLGAHGVLVGEGTANVAVVSPVNVGDVLTSTGAGSDPTWQANAGGGGYDYVQMQSFG